MGKKLIHLTATSVYILMFKFVLSQTSAEKEMKDSDRLFMSLIRSIEERRAGVNTKIKEKQKAAETRAEELVNELQQEIDELQRRNAEMEELRDSEDHLHVLQVTIDLKTATVVSSGVSRLKDRNWSKLHLLGYSQFHFSIT